MQPEKQAFVELNTLAIVGVSRGQGFGRAAFRALRRRGYRVFPVNAQADEIEGERCYRRLDDLPEKVGGVVTVVPPAETEKVVADCARLGIGRIWMQQGSESPEAVRLAREKGLAEVHGACILMYARPAGIHRFHGWLWKRLGKE